jgi:hypothetical protein
MSRRADELGAAIKGLWRRRILLDLIILAAIVWVANYLNIRSYGLYEDDYAAVSRTLGWHLSDLVSYLGFVGRFPQGRPLHFLLPTTLALAGRQLGGLSGIYALGYLVHVANAWLFYFLLRRLGLGVGAVVGAIALVLFPANTSHIFLNHALGKHTSLTFLLIASHFYLSDRKPVAHLVSLACLLTHEPLYLVFLAMPLLGPLQGRALAKEMLRHFLVWAGILLAVAALRIAIGEDRIEAVVAGPQAFAATMGKILAALAIGPAVSVGSFLTGPVWVAQHWPGQYSLILLAVFMLLAWRLSRPSDRATEAGWEAPSGTGSRVGEAASTRLVVASVFMLSLAYGASFTHYPPTVLAGRLTSVHIAAAFGIALLFGYICSIPLRRAHADWRGILLIGALSLYLSILVAYRMTIQLDFEQAWKNQKTFWSKVVSLVPDVKDGTMIFVLNHDLPTTRFILSNSWADPIVLAQLYEFPDRWRAAPRLFVVPADWTASIVAQGNDLKWEVPAATWLPHWETLPDGNVILLEMENGRLVRRAGTLPVADRWLTLKPIPQEPRVRFREGPLYGYLISGE